MRVRSLTAPGLKRRLSTVGAALLFVGCGGGAKDTEPNFGDGGSIDVTTAHPHAKSDGSAGAQLAAPDGATSCSTNEQCDPHNPCIAYTCVTTQSQELSQGYCSYAPIDGGSCSLAPDAGPGGGGAGTPSVCTVGSSTEDGGGGVVTLACGRGYYGLAIDRTSAYLSLSVPGTIVQVSLDGGALTTLATGQNGPGTLAVDSTSVYWANNADSVSGTGSIAKVAIGGGETFTLASSQNAPLSIAVQASNVYWTDLFDSVTSMPIDGGAPTTFTTQPGYEPWGLAIDATTIYWSGLSNGDIGTSEVMTVPIAGGTPTTLASHRPNPMAMAVDSTNLYWIEGGTPPANYHDGAIVKMALSGGSPDTLAANQYNPLFLAIDGASVYWSNDAPGGAVMKVPISGGAPTTIASGQSYASGVAVDDTYVYWAAALTGVFKAPK